MGLDGCVQRCVVSDSFLIGREWDVAVWEVEEILGGKIGGGFSLWIVGT